MFSALRRFWIALLLSLPLYAQITVAPLVMPRKQFLDIAARPLAQGHVCTYLTGTTTPQVTYTDYTATVANDICDPSTIPLYSDGITLDDGGYASIWIKCTDSPYKIVVYDRNGVLQWSEDGVNYPGCGTGGGGGPVVQFIPTPNQGRWAIEFWTGSGVSIYGDTQTQSGTTLQDNVATATAPASRTFGTSAVDGNVASEVGLKTIWVTGTRHLYRQMYYQLDSIITRRDWFGGFTDQTAATMGVSDNPAGNYASFWYCNDGVGAGCQKGGVDYDATNFWCATKDGTTQTLTNSGVAADTNRHKTEIYESSSGTYKFYIDGSLVCSNSTHAPTAGTVVRYAQTVTCMGCASGQSFTEAWWYTQADF
jgi:hypothetical protein